MSEEPSSSAIVPIEDRLSNLPDAIIHHILSFLPTKFAAATSVLSTRWRYLFLDVPKIDFDESLVFKNPDLKGRKYGVIKNDELMFQGVQCFAARLEKSHETSVKEFRLRLLDISRGKMDLVKVWISSPLCSNIEVVDISVERVRYCCEDREYVPPEIFGRKSLVVLKLHGNFILSVPELELSCLPRLKVFSLAGQARLISNKRGWEVGVSWPLLEFLQISDMDYCDVGLVDISIPSLKKLVWNVPLQVDSIVLNTPSLEYLECNCFLCPLVASTCDMKSLVRADLCFSFFDKLELDEHDQFQQLIDEMYNIKFLCLRGYAIECLNRKNRMLPEFLNLTHLELMASWVENWKLLETLLHIAPNLEVLVCDMSGDEFGRDTLLQFGAKDKPRCLDEHLTEVKIKNFSGRRYEFLIVRYLLEHGSVLQKMSISASKADCPRKWVYNILLSLRRRSENCKLVLH